MLLRKNKDNVFSVQPYGLIHKKRPGERNWARPSGNFGKYDGISRAYTGVWVDSIQYTEKLT